MLVALGPWACTSAEHHEPAPGPVVPREGFVLPTPVGARALPESFFGVVVAEDGLWGMSGPGRSLSVIREGPLPPMDPAMGLGRPMIDELYDAVAERFDGATAEDPLEVIWLVDARVQLEVVARALYTVGRAGPSRMWLATGSITAPTVIEIAMPPFTGPGRDTAPPDYVADLELVVVGDRVTAVAHPRPVGDPPGLAALGAELAPDPRPIRTRDGQCQRPLHATLRDVGEALCELSGPYALTVDVPLRGMTHGELLERLAADPRPPRCVAGPPRLSVSAEPVALRCEGAVTVSELPARFAAEARARSAAVEADPEFE
ncbi:hypothetical protein [Paraliomyxa miuraensis]|uniref:hypothetical protein n=1 Tax=Paraliomyxa miuraensis TaxID=376150 RepID=UPI0022505AFE|nr:hypothetical protein [Paraliomyxa miuraensis]MCX4240127.1 hypothetical protein [Paraliomyxa miuraensis]